MLSPGSSFLYYFLDKTVSGNDPYYELKKKMFDIKLSFSEFSGEETLLSQATLFGRKSPVGETEHSIETESGKCAPQKDFLRILRMKIFIVNDQFGHRGSTQAILSLDMYFIVLLKCLCPGNFKQRPLSAFKHCFYIEKREISTMYSYVG